MKFILENNLSRIAKWLRFLGHEVRVLKGEVKLGKLAKFEGFVFITTSRRWFDTLEDRGFQVFLVPREDWKLQLCMVIKHFDLEPALRLDLCAYCGHSLERVRKEDFKDRIPPTAYESAYDFTYCHECDALFWKGTHFEGMKRTLRDVLELCYSDPKP